MSKYCSDCQFLNIGKAKVDGVYHCSKKKDFTNASNPACEKFEKNWIGSYEQQRLYDLGKEAKNKTKDKPIGFWIGVLIVLIILLIIGKLSGY